MSVENLRNENQRCHLKPVCRQKAGMNFFLSDLSRFDAGKPVCRLQKNEIFWVFLCVTFVVLNSGIFCDEHLGVSDGDVRLNFMQFGEGRKDIRGKESSVKLK